MASATAFSCGPPSQEFRKAFKDVCCFNLGLKQFQASAAFTWACRWQFQASAAFT